MYTYMARVGLHITLSVHTNVPVLPDKYVISPSLRVAPYTVLSYVTSLCPHAIIILLLYPIYVWYMYCIWNMIAVHVHVHVHVHTCSYYSLWAMYNIDLNNHNTCI